MFTPDEIFKRIYKKIYGMDPVNFKICARGGRIFFVEATGPGMEYPMYRIESYGKHATIIPFLRSEVFEYETRKII